MIRQILGYSEKDPFNYSEEWKDLYDVCITMYFWDNEKEWLNGQYHYSIETANFYCRVVPDCPASFQFGHRSNDPYGPIVLKRAIDHNHSEIKLDTSMPKETSETMKKLMKEIAYYRYLFKLLDKKSLGTLFNSRLLILRKRKETIKRKEMNNRNMINAMIPQSEQETLPRQIEEAIEKCSINQNESIMEENRMMLEDVNNIEDANFIRVMKSSFPFKENKQLKKEEDGSLRTIALPEDKATNQKELFQKRKEYYSKDGILRTILKREQINADDVCAALEEHPVSKENTTIPLKPIFKKYNKQLFTHTKRQIGLLRGALARATYMEQRILAEHGDMAIHVKGLFSPSLRYRIEHDISRQKS